MLVAQLLIAGLLIGGIYSLVAIGINLVFGVLRMINFAHGEFVMVAMYLTFVLFSVVSIDPFIAVLIVAPVGFIFGAVVYLLMIRPLMRHDTFVQVFATLGLSILLLNATLFFASGTVRTVVPEYANATISVAGIPISVTRLIAFGVACVAALIFFLFVGFTPGGRKMRAAAQDPAALATLGVNVDRVHMYTFATGAVLAAVAGAALAPITPIFPEVGQQLVLVGFVVVVLGGLGSFTGALIGGLAVGIIETFGGFFVGEGLRQLIYFLALLGILIVRPAGLFGKRGAEEFKVA